MSAQHARDHLAQAYDAWITANMAAFGMDVRDNPDAAQTLKDEADIDVEAALLETQTIDEDTIVDYIGYDYETASIAFTLGSGEWLTLDKDGNTARGGSTE